MTRSGRERLACRGSLLEPWPCLSVGQVTFHAYQTQLVPLHNDDAIWALLSSETPVWNIAPIATSRRVNAWNVHRNVHRNTSNQRQDDRVLTTTVANPSGVGGLKVKRRRYTTARMKAIAVCAASLDRPAWIRTQRAGAARHLPEFGTSIDIYPWSHNTQRRLLLTLYSDIGDVSSRDANSPTSGITARAFTCARWLTVMACMQEDRILTEVRGKQIAINAGDFNAVHRDLWYITSHDESINKL